jgi:LysM repeat protein
MLPSPPSAHQQGAAPQEFIDYIVQRGDTLPGIALQRDMSIREVKTLNKLWGDAIWPGQKLRVRKRDRPNTSSNNNNNSNNNINNNNNNNITNNNDNNNNINNNINNINNNSNNNNEDGRRARASSEQTLQRRLTVGSHNSLPLLVRLRDLFEHHDAMYSHHHVISKVTRKTATKVSAASRRYVSAAPPELRDGSADNEGEKIITVAAVLMRLRPFAAVSGNITLTSNRLMFVPNLQVMRVFC